MFEGELLEASDELNVAFPDRFHRLIGDSNSHTFIIRQFNVQLGGVMVSQWISVMVNQSEAWTNIRE
ncbi:MAG: hypothetical protein MRZ79_11890 [Bacteroidia bacterium]|nr:hypothetical protein [Bacteroidia bacterium]